MPNTLGAGVQPLQQQQQQQQLLQLLQSGGIGALGGLESFGGMLQPQAQPLQQQKKGFLKGVKQVLKGQQSQFITAPRFLPGQLQQLGDILASGSRALAEQPYSFGPIEEQARERFQQQTIPSLAERFAGLGALGSSSFGRQLGQAGRGFERDLAAQQSKFALQRMDPLSRLLGLGLTEPYLSNLQAGSQGILPRLLAGLAKSGTSYATGGAL